MPDALLHAADSNADFGWQLGKFRRGRQTGSFVFHVDEHTLGVDRYAYASRGAVRVFVHVGKTLLNHSKDSGFQIPRHANGTVGQLYIDEDSAALRKALDECTQSREDTQFLE